MDEIFIAIMEQIAQEMPELSLIDEDYGQLEMGAEEDQYPVTFPCVLIGNTNSDWHDLGYGAQKSESALTVRLAIDCYDDTSYASGTYDKVRERHPRNYTSRCSVCNARTTLRRWYARKAVRMPCRITSRSMK